jgi:tetratricopeptide (TPR) repeat protein
LAEQASSQILGPQQQSWLARLEKEHDNLRAALSRYREDPDLASLDKGLRLAGALWRFWWLRGHLSEGREHLTALLARKGTDAASPITATALGAAGHLAHCQGDYTQATSLLEQALDIEHALDDRSGEADMRFHLGDVASNQGDYASARSLLEQALTLYKDLGTGMARRRAWAGSVILPASRATIPWRAPCRKPLWRSTGNWEIA